MADRLGGRVTRLLSVRRAIGLALVAVVVPLASSPAAAETPPPEPGRVLLLSLPGLTWADIQDYDLPAIEAFMEDASLADLAPRGVSATSTPGAAYLTISAGTRSAGEPITDGQQLAVADQSAGSSAGDIFQRRTGTDPDGGYVALGWPSLVRINAGEPYDAVLGLLTETLREERLGSAAVGNADGTDTVGPSYERQVGLAAVDEEGVIPTGELGTDLLVEDPSVPFGRRLDPERVVEAFRQAWEGPGPFERGMVVVEASDLARTMRYRSRVDAARYEELWATALQETDALVADLLDEVDLDRDAAFLMAPYNLPGDRDLTVAALRAPGEPAGYLRSASTQRSGFLTLVDVGPTVLELLGVERPVEMEGRPVEAVSSGDSLDARVERLVSLNAASRFRERTLFPTTLVVVLLLAVVCAVAAVQVARGSSERAKRVVRGLCLGVLAIMPFSYLARGFPLEDLGSGFYWAFVLAGAALVAVAATVVASSAGRYRRALVAVLVLVLAVPVADVMTGSHLSLSAAFGYSPTGNSRLYGISNYSFGQVAAATCLLAAFLAAGFATRGDERRGRVLAIVLLVAMLVVIGVPMWGSDVGGILALTPTILLFAALVWRHRLQMRHVVIGLVATVAAVTAFGLLDLARPPEERAHLGRLFERISDEGLQPLLSIMERKLLANLGVSTTSFWVAAIPVAVAFVVFLVKYPGRPMARLDERIPTLRAGLLAAALAALLGSMVNDSGAIVGGVTLLVVAAALAHLALEPESVTTAPVPEAEAPEAEEVAAARPNGTSVAAPTPPVTTGGTP